MEHEPQQFTSNFFSLSKDIRKREKRKRERKREREKEREKRNKMDQGIVVGCTHRQKRNNNRMSDDLRKQTISELITYRKKTGLQGTTRPNKKSRKNWEQDSKVSPHHYHQEDTLTPGTIENTPSMAPQLKLDENGNITIDENSLMVATDAPSTSLDDNQVARVVDGPDRINSASYSKRTTTERWTKEETELFYRGLQQFGTDFSLVAQLFPKRTRKQVKAKFKREEKTAPEKVDAALSARTPMTSRKVAVDNNTLLSTSSSTALETNE